MAPPKEVPKEVIDLVEHFEREADAFRSPSYSEAHLRHQFLDPFFEALGWDVNNRQRHAEAYKDVIHEDAIKVGGETKAPDYCFRIGGTRKFFVEAKKPALNLRDDPAPAFQLRRYAWSSRLPLSVLTDFQELALYDCRIKPLPRDKASVARVRYFTCRDYLENWDEIAGILSKDAVLKGSFDRFVEAKRLKRGTAQVDDAFLQEIEEWRKELASNIALRNERLTQREVNFAVQRTIDRIIFLRICEDRGIESYGQLRKLADGAGIYRALCTIFERADEKYNSGLFHFHAEKDRAEQPDSLTLKLAVDDERLKRIFKRLYYPDSPYEFSVLPADILGQVYEQFLGKVIRLTPGHQARVEDKPEVKKAGGVYYTPTYIVDYIVRNTVGVLLGGDRQGSALGAWPSHAAQTETQAQVEERAQVEGQAQVEERAFRPASPPPLPELSSRASAAAPNELSSRASATADFPSELSSRASATGAERSDAERERDARDLGFRPSQASLTPKQASRLRILDPACGSGSFLIGAYQYLLDWHRDWYVNDGPEKHRKELYQGAGGEWRLSISEKKRILRNNIYGVDIDSQAVEVTNLSLLLKVLEGESEQTLNTTLRLFHERALPGLGSNIKCGNSLIGPDFYSGQQMSLLGEDERLRINAFDWNAEFPEIMKAGGFDAVIGNPPYGALLTKPEETHLRQRFSASTKDLDTYSLFMEQALRLCKPLGKVAMIVPTGWYSGPKFSALRRLVATHTDPESFINLPYDVFPAWVDTTIFVLSNKDAPAQWPLHKGHAVGLRTFPKRHRITSWQEIGAGQVRADFTEWFRGGGDEFLTYADTSTTSLIRKIQKQGKPISEFADIQRGVTPFSLTESKTHSSSRRAFDGTVRRYAFTPGPRQYVRFDATLAEPKPEKYFCGPRLLLRELISRQVRLQATHVTADFVTNKSMQSILQLPEGPALTISWLVSIAV